jgi:hypothetical protein
MDQSQALVELLGFERVEPRCKICRSPHRREIDAMLVTGWQQAEVRRHWNEHLGRDAFSASNLSVHAARHLNPLDPALWPIRYRCVELLLEQASQGDTLAFPLAENISALLQLLQSFGFSGINANLVEVETSDILRAVKARGELGELAASGRQASAQHQEEAVRREFDLFLQAVRYVVSAAEQNKIVERFEELLSENGIIDQPT